MIFQVTESWIHPEFGGPMHIHVRRFQLSEFCQRLAYYKERKEEKYPDVVVQIVEDDTP